MKSVLTQAEVQTQVVAVKLEEQRSSKSVHRVLEPYVTPRLERHQNFVLVTGTSLTVETLLGTNRLLEEA
jgi:hypothetical protein